MGQQYESHSPPPRPGGGGAAPIMGVMGGGCAVLIGLILLGAFFLPWIGGYGQGDISGFDFVKEEIGSDNTLGKMLFKLIAGSSALAGCGSVVFGLGLAGGAFVARRNAAFKSWMAASIGGMVVLAAFWPCFLWTFALLEIPLLARATEFLKIGVWLSLGGAVFLVVASFIGLVSAFMTQQQQS